MKPLAIIILIALTSACAFADAEYPKIKLDNGKIQVSIYLPDVNHGYYRGTRFDWSGIIDRIDHAGHHFMRLCI